MKKAPIDIILAGVQNGILNIEDAKTLLEAIYDHNPTVFSYPKYNP